MHVSKGAATKCQGKFGRWPKWATTWIMTACEGEIWTPNDRFISTKWVPIHRLVGALNLIAAESGVGGFIEIGVWSWTYVKPREV